MKKIYIEPRMKVAGMLPEDHILLGHSLDWADAKRKKDWDDEDWKEKEEDTTSAQNLWDNIWGEED